MFGRKKQTKEKVELTKESYQKAKGVFRYLRPYSFLIFIGLICLLLSTAGSFLFPILLGNLVDAGTPNALDNSPVAAVAGDVLDDLKDVDVVAVILLVLFFVQAIFSFFRIYIFNHITEKVLAALRLDTYAHLVKLPLAFYSKRRVGELNSRISSDTATLSGVMTTSIAEFFRQIIMLFASIVYLFIYSTDLTLAMLATLPVVAISAVFFGRFIKKLSKTTQDEIANSNTIVEETMTGILNVKAFANEVYEIVRYRNANERIRKIAMKGAGWRAAFVSFIIFFVFGAIVFIIWRAVNMGVNNGELVTFITFCVLIGASISSLPDLYSSLQKAVGASENLMNILEETPEDLDTEAKTQINKVAGDVAFENVSFAYPSRKDSPVLQDLSFEVKAGKLAAIVGPSGAGKSTIVSMLLRFYEPESGLIRIDGKPATEYSLTELRKQMALVPQEVLLFGGSIRENIAYGDPDATEEQIIEAAKKANAHEFVSNFSGRVRYLGR